MLTIFCLSALALAQKVACQYDRSLDFSQFHTYKWVTVGSSSGISQATAENIVNLVNAQLAQKRLTPVVGDRVPDLYVAYQTSVAPQQQELNWFNSGGDWKGSFGQPATTETIETGHPRDRFLRSRPEATGLARHGHQFTGPERQHRQELQQPSEGHREVAQALSAGTEEDRGQTGNGPRPVAVKAWLKNTDLEA